MSFGSTTISTSEPRLGALTFQNSAYGLPIPLFWGTSRLAGNLIWYGDFKAIANTTTTSSGGKGGDVESQNTTYTYTTAFMMGLCEGAVSSIGTVWKDKDITTFSALGLTLLTGALPQSVWSHLTTNHPSEAISYPGLAIVAHSALQLGGSASLPQLSFEVSGPRQFGSGIVDARPDEIVTDMLSAAVYGAGFPSARLSLATYRTYTQAEGLFLSPFINSQQPASQHLEEILLATNSAPLWSEGLLKLIPYGDTAVTGNGTTYTPAITPQYDLTDDDFIVTGAESPIVVRRKPSADAYNQFQVEYRNRDNDYNIDVAEAKDLGNISTFGLRAADPVRLHAICKGGVADKVANMLMQRKLYIRNEYEFRLAWRHCLLEPMDIVTLTHAPLGLSLFQVRIVEIEEDENGLLRVIAEEFPFGVATPAAIQTQTPSGYSVDFNVAPGNANTPVVFEPPMSLSGQPEVWLATSGGSSWGGAEVWVSIDNATYKQAGTIYGPARHGTLSAILASGSDPDTTNTLAVDLTVSGGTLTGGTLEDRDLYTTLCYADGELVSYQNATLTAANKYSLTSLRRGVHGTPVGSHASGSKFARLDQAVFRFPYTPDYLGKTLYVKLRSFNIYGGALQSLADVTPVTYAIAGAAVGTVQGFALAQPWVSSTLSVKWTAYDGASHYKMEVWVSGVLKRTVDNITATAFDYTIEDSKADGGPYRSIELRLFAKTSTGQSTSAAVLTVSNPQFVSGDVTGMVVEAGPGQINIKADKPAAIDYAGTIIWAGDTSVFTPSDLNKVYDGPAPFFVYVVAGGTTKYIKMAHYDTFGKDSLGVSTSVGATSILAGGVPTVSTLPGSTYLVYDVVFYDGDDKLYRWNGTTYTKAVDGSDILASSVTADKIFTANLAAITANLGNITAGTFTMDAAGYIKAGQTAYNTGVGFWMGGTGGVFKWSLGNPAGDHITWDGTTLSVSGTLTVDYADVTGTKPPVDATRNVIYSQPTLPSAPAEGDLWYNTLDLLPSYSIDFTAGEIPDELVFSRASTAGYYDETGTWQTAAVNELRRAYDPISGKPKGYLAEANTTNMLLNSDTLSTQNVTVTAATHTLTFEGTGTVTLTGAFSGSLAGTGAKDRVRLTFAATAGTLTVTVSGTVKRAQLEAKPHATSYYASGATAATRGTEQCYIPLGAWFNASEGTLIAETEFPQHGAKTAALIDQNRYFAALGQDVASNYDIGMYYRGAVDGGMVGIVIDVTEQMRLDAMPGTQEMQEGVTYSCLFGYKLNECKVAVLGNVVTDTAVTVPSGLTRLYIGRLDSGNNADAYIRKIRYYNRVVTEAEAKVLSSGVPAGATAVWTAAGRWEVLSNPDLIAPALVAADAAFEAAVNAQATADGKIETFYQTTAPTVGMAEGDLWFDTDAGNKLYIYTSGVWTSAQDSAIATAISDAADAQATADGKVTTFFTTTTPTATAVGDLWYNSTTKLLQRWSGSAWVVVANAFSATSELTNNSGWDGTAAALTTGVTINGGGITLGSGGALKGGQTDYHTGSGWFLGYSGGTYKFSIGNPAGTYMTWDGTELRINGTFDKYEAGNLAIASANTDRYMTVANATATATAKFKEIAINGAGTIRVFVRAYRKFTFSSGYGGFAITTLRIRKNGSVVHSFSGTAIGYPLMTTTTIMQEETVDISVVNGDLIQLYWEASADQLAATGGSYQYWIDAFELRADTAPAPVVNID